MNQQQLQSPTDSMRVDQHYPESLQSNSPGIDLSEIARSEQERLRMETKKDIEKKIAEKQRLQQQQQKPSEMNKSNDEPFKKMPIQLQKDIIEKSRAMKDQCLERLDGESSKR